MTDKVGPEFKYKAFLSYRNADGRQAAWLHKRLEEYVVPRALVGTAGEHGTIPRRLGRVFRDRDETRPAQDLETVIADELSSSEQLIVLCTPSAAAPGSWVPREIELFKARRPNGPIHAVIGAGAPPACFPRPLLTVTSDGRLEAPLAADIRPAPEGGVDGAEKGVIRLIAALIGVRFDSLWRREERRRRVRRFVLAAELCGTAFVALLFVLLANSYRSHAVVDLNLLGIAKIADSVGMIGTNETPENNGVRVFVQRAGLSGRWRCVVPASDVILRIHARYHDHDERALSLHLTLEPSFDPRRKWIRFDLPAAQQIVAHPGMAYVPAGKWFHGQENVPRMNKTGFWIDIRPPTVAEYGPIAQRLMQNGALGADSSLLLVARQQHGAVGQTGLTQLQSLNKDLGSIFGTLSMATTPTVSAPGDVAIGLADLPCDACPAPMTRHEAEVYCRSRGMRLPTALEWELAVRGVDGRIYPWGNRFDARRANVAGLPDKGGPSPSLKPVDRYRQYPSPFGLIDTVGNAGDWVINDVSSYERVYMGATYQYNPEDATAFRLLPVTDSDYLVRQITARCVDPASSSLAR
jgi:formylglycine-generating enzyme required for sulfatase activity